MDSRRPPKPARELTVTVEWFGDKHEVTFAEHQRAAPLPWVDLRVLDGEAYLWRPPPPAKRRSRRASRALAEPPEMIERVLGELELNGPRWIAMLPPAGSGATATLPRRRSTRSQRPLRGSSRGAKPEVRPA
jgi:hypothetical protein